MAPRPEAYVKAWHELKNHLQAKADAMPNGTTAKMSVLAILLQMATLEPNEDE